MNFLAFFTLLAFTTQSFAYPAPPTDPQHPGSSVYEYGVEQSAVRIDGRKVDIFLPQGKQNAPVIIFGHGQATDVEGYRLTFEHLAKKGVAVIHPQYDSGFFDQDWQRMGKDFAVLSEKAMAQLSGRFDLGSVIFSGHSKGGYVALTSAGLPSTGAKIKPSAIVLFNPAGYDKASIKNIDRRIPVTVTWSQADTIIKESLVREIFGAVPAQQKQLIVLTNYPDLQADHFFSLSKSFFFGGKDGVSPFHYYGTWKWLIGAAQDLEQKSQVTNPFIYGDLAGTTGAADLNHSVERAW